MLPKEKKVKIPLPTSVEWSDGNGNVRMKPRELNEKDREELSFLFNPDYEMSMGEKRGWKGKKRRGGRWKHSFFSQFLMDKPDLFTWYMLAQ